MHDAQLLKERIERLAKSYAVAVKGQAFPEPVEHDPDVTCIAASSWAMANCFEIASKLRSENKAWYIDSRIANIISPGRRFRTRELTLLPLRESRGICLCDQIPLVLRSQFGASAFDIS
jgi:hypothetical protein